VAVAGIVVMPESAVDIAGGYGMSPGNETAKGFMKKLAGKPGVVDVRSSTASSSEGSATGGEFHIGPLASCTKSEHKS